MPGFFLWSVKNPEASPYITSNFDIKYENPNSKEDLSTE